MFMRRKNSEPQQAIEENHQETASCEKQFGPPIRLVRRRARFGQPDQDNLEFMQTQTTYRDDEDTLITEDEITGVVVACGHRIAGPTNVPGKCNHPGCGYVCQDCLLSCPRGGSRCLQTMCKKHSLEINGIRYCFPCAKVLIVKKVISFPFILLAKLFTAIFTEGHE